MNLRDGWRLALGTLTRIPVAPPARVDSSSAGAAMLLAPLAALPLGLGVAAVLVVGDAVGTAPLASGLVAVALLAWATRLLHLDGLSDTVDGLTASHERSRSLEVMRSGTAGPAGVVALVLVCGVQAVGFASLADGWRGAYAAAAAVVLSRAALAVACLRGVPSARPEGLGAAVAGSVPPVAALAVWVVLGAALAVPLLLWGAGPAAVVAPVLALAAVGAWLVVAGRRLGGITGDVLGACVETALVVLLLCLA